MIIIIRKQKKLMRKLLFNQFKKKIANKNVYSPIIIMSCFSENVYYVLKISKICSHINHYYRIILPRSWKMTPIISFCLIMRTQKLCFEICT